MVAAEVAFAALGEGRQRDTLTAYDDAWKQSWVYEDLWKVRNVKPGLKWGLWAGMAHGGAHMWLADLGLGALAPWTLRHARADHATLRPAAEMPRIDYPKPDGVLTFDTVTGANAVADGTAVWARVLDGASDFVLDFKSITTTGGGGDLELNTVTLITGGPVSVSSATITEGNP
jgi:hypothetical protein